MEVARRHNLAALPLHTITQEFGKAGLLERFNIEIQKFDDADRELLQKAQILADELHSEQRRTSEPYMNHILRVAIRVMSHYRVEDVDVIIAALLHDSVEDHAEKMADFPAVNKRHSALEFLSDQFDPRVADLVSKVTNPVLAPGSSKTEQYHQHVKAILLEDPWARVIKTADFTDNCVGILYTTDPNKINHLAARYSALIPVFKEAILMDDTPLPPDVVEHIVSQMTTAQERVDSVLAA